MDTKLPLPLTVAVILSLFLSCAAFSVANKSHDDDPAELKVKVQRLEHELDLMNDAVQELTSQAASQRETNRKLIELIGMTVPEVKP